MANRSRLFRAAGALGAGALIALTLTIAPSAAASTASASADPGIVSTTAQLSPDVAATVKAPGADARNKALASYWTADRMKSALPDSELPSVKAMAAAKPAAAAPTQASGAPTRIAAADATATPKPANPANSAGGDAVTPNAYYPNYPVGSPPARTAGKVFFTSFGLNYVCSGTIVNTEGKSTVWTAGHCVSDGGAWNTNWIFVPNYANSSAPYGYWYSSALWTTTAWLNNNNDYANDVGASIMSRNNGSRITDYLGGQGITWNAGIGAYMYAFGYPQAAPFTGCCLVAEQGYTYDGGGGTIYMANAMTGGSSGGSWLASFDGNWGYINGHNDFKYNASPQYMYSPYYGNQVASLYNSVRNLST
ncbi:MAG: trypsin-like serine peptidase [Catenulispora sp.]